jgi:hypothetical protein
VSILDTEFMDCEHDVLSVHVFEVSKVCFMLVSCDVVTGPVWLSTSEGDRGCANRYNAVSLQNIKEVLKEIHRR